MNHFLLFLSQFLSYIVLMVIIAAVAACGFVLGRVMRKKKNRKLAAHTTTGDGGASEV